MQSGDQNGLDGSYLDCYMSEHQDVSGEDVQRHVAHMISNEWKFWSQISFHHHFPIFVSMLLEWSPSCTTIRAIQAFLISRNMSIH